VLAAGFVLPTLAIRALIARHRRRAEDDGVRAAALGLCLAVLALALGLVWDGLLASGAACALGPTLALALALLAAPPHPRHLTRVGLLTLAATGLGAVVLVAALRAG
jgi:hypothetical protein